MKHQMTHLLLLVCCFWSCKSQKKDDGLLSDLAALTRVLESELSRANRISPLPSMKEEKGNRAQELLALDLLLLSRLGPQEVDQPLRLLGIGTARRMGRRGSPTTVETYFIRLADKTFVQNLYLSEQVGSEMAAALTPETSKPLLLLKSLKEDNERKMFQVTYADRSQKIVICERSKCQEVVESSKPFDPSN